MTLVHRRAVLGTAVALSAWSYARTARAADADAVVPIQALDQVLLASMKAGRGTPFTQRYAMLAPVIERAFDLPAILQASVGLRWAGVSAAEKTRLLDAFRKFTVCSYAANFNQYSGEKLEILPGSRMVGPDQVVETNLVGTDSTRIDYVMHKAADGWKVVDVLLNGSISQVAVNRSDWRSLLASGTDGLIASLRQKVADLSGGAIN